MAPAATTAIESSTAVAVTKTPQPAVEEVEKEVTPLEAISHGEVLPGKS